MLKLWADSKHKSFRDFVRPKLLKLGVDYEVIDDLVGVNPGDVILAFGPKKLAALKGRSIVPKNRAIGSLRGRVFEWEDAKILLTWDPTLAYFDYQFRPEIIWDLKLAKRLAVTGTTIPVFGSYSEVENFAHVEELAKEQIKKHNRCDASIDLETVGTDWMDPQAWIVAVSITIAPGRSYVKYFKEDEGIEPEVLDQLRWFFSGDTRVFVGGANFKFDMLWMMAKWGIRDFKNFTFDTTLVGSLLQENRSNSLNLHAKIYTPLGGYDDEFNQKYDKGQMHLIPKEDVVVYAGGDTDACFRVAATMRTHLAKRRRLHRFYTRLLHPAQNAVRKMEYRGMCVDQHKYMELDEELASAIEDATQRMLDMLPRKLALKHHKDLNPSRPAIVRDFLFSRQGLALKPKMLTAKTEQPSTSGEHFAMFKDNPKAAPFIEAYLDFGHARKTKSTYVDGFLKHLRSDGRFHPSYILFRGIFHGDKSSDDSSGGRTGRTSVREPAYQTIPKHTDWAKPLRSVYVPPPGYVILDIDFSQGELRITACIANEPTMLEGYKQGIDMHLKTGAALNEIPWEEALALRMANDPVIKVIRQGGKAGNFGLIYGMGAAGFVHYARNSYGVILTLAEANEFIEAFFGMYTGLHPWHEDTIRRASKQGYIESPLGRVRHLPLINSFMQDVRAQSERQAINTGVQATLTDMGLLAMAELDRAYPDLWIFGFTHDSLSFYVPEDDYIGWAKRIKDVMENLPLAQFGWAPQLDFPVEVEYGLNNLAETVELPIA